MSTYTLNLQEPAEITYVDLPVGYPQLSGGDTYQPAAYTEGSSSLVSVAILLPIDPAERVVVPGTLLYTTDASGDNGMIYCQLTIIEGTSTTEQLSMIKFSFEPEHGAETAGITIFVSEGKAKKGGLGDRKLGKVVMDSNIMPTGY
ncbi:hypothetical protein HNQ91_000355 [Filimonas zeae]|uniref:Uncharacterized protein n=1 Tax=Filimonas zeae TaxID=1737353 RepID=A0A917INQ9_9BACT|nr:hypothetical protein [Filimonas zeae]MDR6337333.1 hypothetical protein [Filimonas zeae]GGH58099.1 hypothetical protein GCM10011379_03490 [Filimonas zeae]